MKASRALLALSLVLVLVAPVVAQSRAKTKSRRASRSRVAKAGPAWPAFEARHGEWVRKREAAASAGVSAPDPLSQYLVEEVIVSGVYDADSGYGVFLHAAPTGNTFFGAPGTVLYNGRIVEIVPAASGFSDDMTVVFAVRSPKGGEERRITKRIEAPPAPSPASTP